MASETTTETRISRLLNQLENPLLNDDEIRRIKEKIEFLQSLGSR